MDVKNVTAPTGTNVDVQLSFLANGVVVDNYTNQWIYITAAGRYIPPWQYGVSLPLNGVQVGSIKFDIPPGQIQAPTVSGQQVHAVFTSGDVSTSLGQATNPASGGSSGGSFAPSVGPQKTLIKSILSIPGGSSSSTLIIPSGTYSLSFWLIPGSLGSVPATVTFIGVQSGIRYLPNWNSESASAASANTMRTRFSFPVGNRDTSITMSFTGAPAVNNAAIDVYALFFPADNSVDASGSTVALAIKPPLVPSGTSISTALVNSALAANVTATVVTAVASQSITVISFEGTIDPNVPATLGFYLAELRGITSGTRVAVAQMHTGSNAGNMAMALRTPTSIYPLQLLSGEGLEVHAAAANAGTIDVTGVLYYTQN